MLTADSKADHSFLNPAPDLISSEGPFESSMEFEPFFPMTSDGAYPDSYAPNGIDLQFSQSSEESYKSTDNASDLLFSDGRRSPSPPPKRHRSLDAFAPIPCQYMSTGASFVPTMYPRKTHHPAACDHMKMYSNQCPGMTVDRAPFTHNEGQYFAPEIQNLDWYLQQQLDQEPQIPVYNDPGALVDRYPVYRSSSCPSRFFTSCSATSSPLQVLPGKLLEGTDDSENDLLFSLTSKRRSNKKRENLPKESTALLKKWLLEHMLMPYPINEEKHLLCCKTGLDISQINNWFINARVRIWKPIVSRVFKKYKTQLLEEAEGDQNLHKRISEAEKSTTMSMISLLSSCPEARKELEGSTLDSVSLVAH